MHTPGTAQIGEGIESSWGDLEESEKEEVAEEEGDSEAAAFECEKVEPEDTSTRRESKNGKYLFFLISDLITSLQKQFRTKMWKVLRKKEPL